MEKLLSIRELDFNKIYMENIHDAIQSVTNDVDGEKMLPILIGVSSLIITSSVYLYYKKRFSYWEKKGIPSPPVKPFLGNLLDLVSAPVIKYESWREKYGSLIGIYFGSEKALVVSDPEIINDVLIRNFEKFQYRRTASGRGLDYENLISQNGLQWKIDRSIASPSLSSGKMKNMFPLMKDAFSLLDEELEKLVREGNDVNFINVYNKLTIIVIARCAFATHVDAFKDPNSTICVMLRKFMNFHPLRVFGRFAFPSWAKKLIRFSSVDPESLEYLGKLLAEIIKQRRNNPRAHYDYHDLLQILIDTNYEYGPNGQVKATNNGFSDTKIIANAIMVFVAGFETTSALLTWTTYLLTVNPHIQDRLYHEVKQAKEKKGDDLDYESLFELKYLDAVLKESLRMFPPIVRFERIAGADHVFSNGLEIEKGTVIHVPVWSVHHSPENFPDPETFNPDRWLPENKDQIKASSFLAFVDGPRNCIGARFALLEAKMTMCGIITKYKFVRSPNTPDKVVINGSAIMIGPQYYVPIRIEKRA